MKMNPGSHLPSPCPAVSGSASTAHIESASADGLSDELWEVIAWKAQSNERSDLHPPPWINNQTSTLPDLTGGIRSIIDRERALDVK